MAELSERERAFLDRLQWTQPLAAGLGVVLTLLGIAYVVWACWVFDPRADPREQTSFDGPIARLGFLYDSYQRTIDKIKPESSVEGLLLDLMKSGTFFSAGIMVLMMRLYIGTLVCLMGLIALTVVVERRRLLRLIEKMQA